MHDQTTNTLVCILNKGSISFFSPLLQQGFLITTKVGCEIQCLLCELFKIVPEFVSDRITTIFLNGMPVDDVTAAVFHDGGALSFSAAMPGLVGATYRKACYLASFRGTITHQNKTNRPVVRSDGCITLKLFNMPMGELGPIFVKHGIRIQGAVLRDC